MRTMKKEMLKVVAVVFAATAFIACNSNASKNNEETANEAATEQVAVSAEGYKLLQQKCFICHMETPNRKMKETMAAPPMLRIKEHYKPSFHSKEAFVEAVVDFVTNPTEEKILMPGAARRFKIMPNLGYTEADVRLISETLYDLDLGTMPKMNKEKGELSLNNGKKWQLIPEDMAHIAKIIEKLGSFESDKAEAYNKLGIDVFNLAKSVLLNSEYDGEILNQIHYFFGNFENDIHSLQAAKTTEEGKQIVAKLKTQFSEFNNYFE